MRLKHQKKFLIEVPLKWYGKFKLLTSEKKKITEIFLLPEGDKVSSITTTFSYSRENLSKIEHRLFERKYVTKYTYVLTEVGLGRSQYIKCTSNADQSKYKLSKTRYHLKFNNKNFYADVYDDNLLGLSILEVDADKDENLILPPYLKITADISDNEIYDKANLARLGSYSYITR